MNGEDEVADALSFQIGNRSGLATTVVSKSNATTRNKVTALRFIVPGRNGNADLVQTIPVSDPIKPPTLSATVSAFTRKADTNTISWTATATTSTLTGTPDAPCTSFDPCPVVVKVMNGEDEVADALSFQIGNRSGLATTVVSKSNATTRNKVTALRFIVPGRNGNADLVQTIPVSDWVESGHDILAAASTFASAAAQLQDPCIESFPVGPSTHNSSLNDYQAACEAERASGKTWVEVFQQLVKTFGSTPIVAPALIHSQDAATRAAIQPPTSGYTAPPADPTITPTLDPTYEANAVNELLARQKTSSSYRYIQLDATQARRAATEVSRRCIDAVVSAGLSGPEEQCRRVAIFSSGSDVATASDHDVDALKQTPSWVSLQYDTANKESERGWYKGSDYKESCKESVAGESQCDEFPYFSTTSGGKPKEGMPIPSLKRISAEDNTWQGTLLKGFYSECGIKAGSTEADRSFLAVPVPSALNVPTTAWCPKP